MTKKVPTHYTVGRVVSEPTAHISKDEHVYLIALVYLLGGMTISALVSSANISNGSYVCVRITAKADGNTTYNCFALNDSAKAMLFGATAYLKAEESM